MDVAFQELLGNPGRINAGFHSRETRSRLWLDVTF